MGDSKENNFHLSYAVFVIHEIWKARNKIKMEHEFFDADRVLHNVLDNSKCYSNAWSKYLYSGHSSHIDDSVIMHINHEHEPDNIVYLYVDVAFDRSNGKVVARVVARGKDGNLKATCYRRFKAQGALEAELVNTEVVALLAIRKGFGRSSTSYKNSTVRRFNRCCFLMAQSTDSLKC
ncbi:hypothetical protein FRX31_009156 [Thalictrum thalictroides]|uniref:Uncharacterized protein n=1 Tax=Thalictrum thalictroides TaxID=46969 RepID=A0A7J6WXD2_THATH|nr:hypothetical protein FRX31_009156 [Thalictrum thalictroides]